MVGANIGQGTRKNNAMKININEQLELVPWRTADGAVRDSKIAEGARLGAARATSHRFLSPGKPDGISTKRLIHHDTPGVCHSKLSTISHQPSTKPCGVSNVPSFSVPSPKSDWLNLDNQAPINDLRPQSASNVTPASFLFMGHYGTFDTTSGAAATLKPNNILVGTPGGESTASHLLFPPAINYQPSTINSFWTDHARFFSSPKNLS
jgi:hypothetical protein